MVTVTIKDETFGGKLINEICLGFKSESVTIKDIIEQRVINEVEHYNKHQPEYYKGLIEPTNAEKTLNGYRVKTKTRIDAEKQVYVALNAFTKNGYFILIDNIQAESLNQAVTLSDRTSISFIKLTPLVGG